MAFVVLSTVVGWWNVVFGELIKVVG